MVQGIQLYIVTSGQDGPQGPKGACMQIYTHTGYTNNEGVWGTKGDLVDVDKLISHLSKMSSQCQVTHILKKRILDADLYVIK